MKKILKIFYFYIFTVILNSCMITKVSVCKTNQEHPEAIYEIEPTYDDQI